MKTPQDSEEFIAQQKEILAQNPECASTSYNLGVALIEQGRLDEAIEAFNDAIDNSSRMFEAYVNLGYIHFKKGDLDQVIETNKKAIERRLSRLNPGMPGVMPIWDLRTCSFQEPMRP